MIKFTPIPGCNYKFDYEKLFRDIASGALPAEQTFRTLVLNDLWFILYFVFKIGVANHPFVVQACQDVENGPDSKTLDLWAREHFKSTILTGAEVVQKILRDPEVTIGVFSHTRPLAKTFLRSVKLLFEGSEFLKQLFPDILYQSPHTQAPKWSEDDGLIVKRKGFPRESTLEAWGLLDGMPTGKHYAHRIYDDVETADVVDNPDTVKKLIDRFDISQNLGTRFGTERIIGTTYSHNGLLTYIRDKKTIHGSLIYRTRIKAATHDGTPTGIPVLLSQEQIDEKRSNEYVFNCQQLLNPTPVGIRRLNGDLLIDIDPHFIPNNLFKFMVIDPAGDSKNGKGDAGSIIVVGVEPKIDDIGASRVFLLDAAISPMRDTEATEEIVRMYLRNGSILQVGVEKVGMTTTEIHVANALAARGRHISLVNRTLVLLKPAGRNKAQKIESALSWPLFNGKLYVSTDVPGVYRDRLRTEMEKFPFWHDDGIDTLAYFYDMVRDFKFLMYMDEDTEEQEDLAKVLPMSRNSITGY